MSSLWAIIKASRAGAYFLSALNAGGTGDLRSKWKENKNWRNRLLLSGVIAASTIAISARTIYRAGKRANAKRKAKQQERYKNTGAPHLKIYDDYGNTPGSFRSNGTPNQPVKVEPQVIEKQPETVINPSNEIDDRPKGKEEQVKGRFNADMICTSDQYLFPRTLKFMEVDSNNEMPNSVKIDYSHGSWYVNGSGIFTDKHEPIYRYGDQKETFIMSKLLNKINKNEYLDLFTIFESFYFQ